MPISPDFRITENAGPATIEPLNETAEAWVDENVSAHLIEFGGVLFDDDLGDEIRAAGFTIHDARDSTPEDDEEVQS